MLEALHSTLPSADYFEANVFQDELSRIWQRQWLCVGRESDWARPGDYRTVSLGDQQVVITRTREQALKAFYNSCRHRGSQLCAPGEGRFAAGRIVCPYHAWAYDLEGALVAMPGVSVPPDLPREELGLYPVALEAWRGFVFINLAAQPTPGLSDSLARHQGEDVTALAAWPLEELALAHREAHTVNCNWKVFWENFLECYHCPGIHRELCKLVPLYSAGVVEAADLPAGHALAGAQRPLREGAVTWSEDGQTPLPWFEGLGEAQQGAGMTFATLLPTMFVVAHVDYVRSVRVLPLAPEQTLLTVDWYLAPEVLASGDVDIGRLTAMGRQVVMEDAQVCEINQRGLRNRPHRAGILMPQEHDVRWFQDWVRERRAGAG